MITESVEIDRSPEDVFRYLNELERHGEWQRRIINSRVETDGPTRVGSRGVDRRRVPGGPRDITYEVTEHDPPSKVSFRGVDGPVRPIGTITVQPLDGGARSRVTLRLDFQGHGIGKLLAPLARRQAAKEVPLDQATLKERLESGA